MANFNLKEYQKTNTNTKIKIFIEYLYEKYSISDNNDIFDNEYFSLFNDNDLVESLEYYISKNNITAQVTAQNYITYITDFFKMLSDEYGIKNDIFTDINLHNQLLTSSKKIISKLKKSESKNIASDEQYENLNSGINDFLDNLYIGDIYDEIAKIKNGEMKNGKLYKRFVSIIPIKLIMKFALGNLTTISLELKDLDMVNKILNVNGFELPLDKELIKLFEIYIKIREYILTQYSLEESKLFIEYDGKPYIRDSINKSSHSYYSAFFKIMYDIIKTQSGDLFASRRILELLDKGIDLSTIAKLSDKSIDKCIKLQRNSMTNNDANEKLQNFFLEDKNNNSKVVVKKKGYLKCPFCGADVKAISNEWVLVQFQSEGTKYLACRKCRGANGT